ncbi:hypothetical protein FTV88_2729 [Heliorestis convoluta]|uniref:Uncharacterized protein n=2 Tax=Heliorestis convoluta TaxID=356322 RepID=A0A5Q2N1D6_9FIRM|nr:hypothetical protein FTV88_2729 [Heliorestis convoluta]
MLLSVELDLAYYFQANSIISQLLQRLTIGIFRALFGGIFILGKKIAVAFFVLSTFVSIAFLNMLIAGFVAYIISFLFNLNLSLEELAKVGLIVFAFNLILTLFKRPKELMKLFHWFRKGK